MDVRKDTKILAAEVIKSVNQFLSEQQLCIANKCDIFEHTLLRMAGITEYGRCQFGKYGEKITISIGNLTPTDAEKFLAFFHANGDQTAKITHSCYKESEDLEYDAESDVYVIYKPNVCFSINAAEFFKNIFPLFKDKIIETKEKTPALLDPYLPKPTLNNTNMAARLFSSTISSPIPIDQTKHPDKVLVFAPARQ